MKTVKIFESVKDDLGQEVEDLHMAGGVQTSNKGGTTVKKGNSSFDQ
jgi:hypothetical protein